MDPEREGSRRDRAVKQENRSACLGSIPSGVYEGDEGMEGNKEEKKGTTIVDMKSSSARERGRKDRTGVVALGAVSTVREVKEAPSKSGQTRLY